MRKSELDEKIAIDYLKKRGFIIQKPTEVYVVEQICGGTSHHYRLLKEKPNKVRHKGKRYCKIDLKNVKWIQL